MSRARTVAALVFVLAPCVVAEAQAPIAIQPLPAAPPPVAAPRVAAPVPVVVVPAPAPVTNPADGPGECVTTTTTTTRCTGAAAPLAAHPAPPPVLVVPPGRYDAPPLVPCPVVIPPGWRLQQDPDGSWWRVRRRHGQAGVWAPGLVLWLSSYAGGLFAGAAEGQFETSFPIAGAFVAATFSEDSGAKIGWAVDGVAQLGGLVMFIVGASLDGKIERLPVSIAPATFYGGGSGVALSGRF